VPIITDFLKAIGLKNIILGIFLIAALTNYAYQNRQIKSLKSNLKKTNATLEKKEQKLKEANEDNKNIIEAYEKTLAIERQIAKEQSVTTEQKEKVAIKHQTLVKEVQKRGEIKQDENSNFTIVSF
jgi:small-conductance mechanosensitive channel